MKKQIALYGIIIIMSISYNLSAENIALDSNISNWSKSIGLFSGYNNNAFKSDSSLSTNINQFNLSLGYDFSDYFGLYTNANYITLINYPERNFLAYELGANYGTPINENETLIFSIDASLLFRDAFNEFSLFNSLYSGMNFGLNYSISETSSLKFETGINSKDYTQLSSLSYLENKTSINYIISFESKTSITIGTGINTKLLSNSNDLQSSTIIEQKDLVELQSPKGKGKNSNSNNSNGNNLNQNKFDSTSSSNINVGMGMGKVISNANISFGIAQNLFENTGISLKYKKSFNISSYNQLTINSYYDFVGDEDLYDDPYSSELESIELKLTQVLFSDYRFQIIGSKIDKNYKYSIINNADQTLKREDNSLSFESNISKDFNFESSFITNLKCTLTYQYFDNNSNDEFFDYSGNFLMLGLEINF